ncbi:MAG: hypothetical protein K2X27_03080 [Candidatus Obscuribacterales bacterium]|nr:hypothetical protein [Candidatus Obscuribacterales bacterium]
MLKRYRKQSGSTIAETGPALLVIFLLIFFPLIDIIGLSWTYGMCWYLNYKISNEIARGKKADAPAIISEQVNLVASSSIASFLGIVPSGIKVASPVFNDTAQPPTVQVTSSIEAKPFITVPWFQAVPGLNAPVTFTISSQLTRELPM